MRPEHFAGSASKDDIPSQPTGFRPHINDIIGGEHHILVMLHHNDGVANVTQFLQRVYQALVVTLVQADTRLVQYIEHIHQLRAYLRSQADTLALSTGKADGTAVQRQIIQTDIEQKLEPRTDFLQDFTGNLLLLAAEMRVYGR